jgi:DNA-binding HxlR family transcriptional regulator
MLVLEALEEHGRLRFTRLGELIGDVSQFPVIPPKVEYELTDLGRGLGEAFCGVWMWAERHRDAIMEARKTFRSSLDPISGKNSIGRI